MLNTLAGTDFDFQLTQAGSPNYLTPTASGNDVVVITDGSVPTMMAGNVINFYLTMADPDAGGVFRGGFFTTSTGEFISSLDDATVIVFANAVPMDESRVTWSTALENGGRVLVASVSNVPEPSIALLGILTTPLLLRRRLRR